MKKLIIAAAIVCAAAISQAATCSWTLSAGGTSLTAPSGVSLASGYKTATMYIMMGEWNASAASADRKALLADLKEDPSVAGAVKEITLANGTFSDTEFTVADQTAGTTYRSYAVVIAETTDGAKYAYFSNTMSESAIEEGTGTASISATMNSTSVKGLSQTSAATAGWYQIKDAPEPTSGLLLLLGVGALALRRKQK